MALLSAETAADAAALLDRADVSHGRVVAVDRDSILFQGVGEQGAYTAWLHGQSVVMVQSGFCADEPAGLHRPEFSTLVR